MDQTVLGRTGLRVSIAGLGCGGFSRLGMATGKTEAESVALVRLAIDSGISLIDTAAAYGTEPIVGKAIADVKRDSVVIATKCNIERDGEVFSVERILESLENSLRNLGTDYIDVFQLHGVSPKRYDHAMSVVVPALLRARDAGKFRFLGITESGASDHAHEALQRAVDDKVFDTAMVAFNMLHRTASDAFFPKAIAAGVGTFVMHAVRSIFARPAQLAAAVRDLAAAGRVPAELATKENPLDFLVHPGGAESVTDAAYRFARYEPGVSVVLFGTGSADHLRENISSLARPPLPEADRTRLLDLFREVSGLGLENHGNRQKAA